MGVRLQLDRALECCDKCAFGLSGLGRILVCMHSSTASDVGAFLDRREHQLRRYTDVTRPNDHTPHEGVYYLVRVGEVGIGRVEL